MDCQDKSENDARTELHIFGPGRVWNCHFVAVNVVAISQVQSVKVLQLLNTSKSLVYCRSLKYTYVYILDQKQEIISLTACYRTSGCVICFDRSLNQLGIIYRAPKQIGHEDSVGLSVCVVHISGLFSVARWKRKATARSLKNLHRKVLLWHPFLTMGDNSDT
jgi:hypothetical protein